ncbi:MAG: phosphopantetheinyl transferase [Chlorobi bacterium]|nr:phosphopantetheinyl transferase [Chlorobiota bacterium]
MNADNRFPEALMPQIPEPRTVHVWTCSSDSEIIRDCTFDAILTPTEKEMAGRFRRDAESGSYKMGRALSRIVAASYLRIDPLQIKFERSPCGKPSITVPSDTNLHFNLSRSGDMAIVAVMYEMEIGIDLEKVRAIPDWETIARYYLTNGERSFVERCEPWERDRAFLTCWVRKEAYVKAIGTGVTVSLDRIDTLRSDGADGEADGNRECYAICDLDLGPLYTCAVAALGPIDEIICLDVAGELVAGTCG